jgi:RecB family exonuclease
LVRNILGVQEVENPEDELQISPSEKGSLIHAVLEQFVKEVRDRPTSGQPRPEDAWTAADRSRLLVIAEEVCDDFEARGVTGRPIFWRQDKKRILVDLLLFLEADDVYRKAHGTRPLEAELAFGIPGSDLGPVALVLPDGRDVKFRGFADRVDLAADGTLYVVDYKTGKADGYKELSEDNPDARGQRLQLAVYGQAARLHANDPMAAVRAEYWFVSTRGRFERVGYAVTPEVLEHVGATVGAMVEGIEAGVFPHHPTASSTTPWVECPFCDPDNMGVAELRRQYERKKADPDMDAFVDLADPAADDPLEIESERLPDA